MSRNSTLDRSRRTPRSLSRCGSTPRPKPPVCFLHLCSTTLPAHVTPTRPFLRYNHHRRSCAQFRSESIDLDLCALQKFLDINNNYWMATTRLFCSTIWTTVIILDNAKYATHFPWFTLGTLEARCMLFIDVLKGLFLAMQVGMRFLSVEHRSPTTQEELNKALEWFYSAPVVLKKDFRRSPSRLAIWMHCVLILQPLVLSLLPRVELSSRAYPIIKDPWTIGMGIGTLCLAFGLCVLEALVLLLAAGVYQSGEGALDHRVHSGVYATCMYGALLGKSLTTRFDWLMWVASDALLWAVANWWEYRRRNKILSELAADIMVTRKEREKSEFGLSVVEKVHVINGSECGLNYLKFEDV